MRQGGHIGDLTPPITESAADFVARVRHHVVVCVDGGEDGVATAARTHVSGLTIRVCYKADECVRITIQGPPRRRVWWFDPDEKPDAMILKARKRLETIFAAPAVPA